MRHWILLFVLILTACRTTSPAIPTPGSTSTAVPAKTATAVVTLSPTPDPTLPTAPQLQPAMEGEIVSFMLDFIVTTEIRDLIDFIENSTEQGIPGPPKANVIVYGPVIYSADHPEWGPNVDEKQPLRVWWYENDALAEVEQKAEAISRYGEEYMKDPATGIFAWGYYAFGIVSVAETSDEAQVYFIASCGPVCGHGIIYTVHRESPGKWHITDQQFLWGS